VLPRELVRVSIFLITAFVLLSWISKRQPMAPLTAAGVISLIVGSLVLFNTPETPSFQRVPVPLIVRPPPSPVGRLFLPW